MANQTYDAIVVGAGYVGCSVAYHLAAAGLKTVLLDRDTVGGGASRCNYGNIQVQDAELEHSLPMVQAGYARFEGLEERLGYNFHLRRIHSLLLIENESQWALMDARRKKLEEAGIISELVPAKRLLEIEPLVDPTYLLGALYYPHEGQIYPFDFLSAFVRRGRKLGMDLYTQSEVTGFDVRGGRVCGVNTTQGNLSAGVTVLTTGAWTAELGRLVERHWDVRYIIGQAMITAAVELVLGGHVTSAAFFEAESSGEEETAAMALTQSDHGHFLLGEAIANRSNFKPDLTACAIRLIAKATTRFFPILAQLDVFRAWATPVAFTLDSLPLLGPVAGLEGLILATAFRSTVIITPLVGEIVAQLVTRGSCDLLDISAFSPNRTIKLDGEDSHAC